MESNNNNKKNESAEKVYQDAQQAMLENEWDEIFQNLQVDKEEYKIFLSASTKIDDGPPPGPWPMYPVMKK